MEYDILTAPQPGDLALQVNRKIREGWTPIGGVATFALMTQDTFRKTYQYAQAITRITPHGNGEYVFANGDAMPLNEGSPV